MSGFYRPAPGQSRLAMAVLVALAVLPWGLAAIDQSFYLGFATRVLIFALAASSLNLVLGFGGMVSLGHAAFFGAGAYLTALLGQAGWQAAWAVLPLAMLGSGLMAGLVGAICLRTRGVYFIMITLAFAQMAYFLCISNSAWGGDDGLALTRRLQLGNWSLADETTLYWLALACLAGSLLLLNRLVQARFGRVIQGIRENPVRMAALGYPVQTYRLVCFALGGALAGLAGALLVNQSGLASPSLLQWTQSGSLLVMVIIGGVGALYGGVVGAVVLLGLEELLSGLTLHWHLGLGVLLLAVVLFAPRGVAAWFGKRHD